MELTASLKKVSDNIYHLCCGVVTHCTFCDNQLGDIIGNEKIPSNSILIVSPIERIRHICDGKAGYLEHFSNIAFVASGKDKDFDNHVVHASLLEEAGATISIFANYTDAHNWSTEKLAAESN